MTPSPSGPPDQQPHDTPSADLPQAVHPLLRTDLVSYGFRGVVERIVIGRGTLGRLATSFAVAIALTAGIYGLYAWLVGLDADGEFFNPAMTLLVVGSQAAQGFFPREVDRYPYLGYTITSALQTAALIYIVFVMVTEPLDGESLFFLLAYALLCVVGEMGRFTIDTRMRRTRMMQAEQAPTQEALRRALHMDR